MKYIIPRQWFDDPLIETERETREKHVSVEPPMVQDHHAWTVLYDAHERPVRRQIGFRSTRRT